LHYKNKIEILLLYSHTITTRLQYIATTIFPSIECTNNATKFEQFNGAKINYSATKISEHECWISPHTLLFETNIKEQQIEFFIWKELPTFFKTEGTIPFDFLAAAFYLLTRYEEYFPHEKMNTIAMLIPIALLTKIIFCICL
jgi:hypothetical protein